MSEKRENLITKRKASQMTQRELAERMGVSQPFVAAFESGKKSWSDERYAQALAEIAYFDTQHTAEERERFRAEIAELCERYHRGEFLGSA